MTQVDVQTSLRKLSEVASGAQIPGARDYQEDAFRLMIFGEDEPSASVEVLLLLADGMGGACWRCACQ